MPFVSASLQSKTAKIFSNPTCLILLVSLFIACFDNNVYWKTLTAIDGVHFTFLLSQFFLLWMVLNLALSFFSIKYVLKPFLIIILMTAAAVTYFMSSYGIVVDKSMIQNVFETDSREAGELVTAKLFLYLFFLGVLPSIVVFFWPVKFNSCGKEIGARALVIILSILIAVASVASVYKEFSIFHRQHKNIRMLVNPVYPIYSFINYIATIHQTASTTITPVATDAKQTPEQKQKSKKSLVIFVVGEAARAQEFQLNGYERQTNPKLSTYPIINFPNTWSCGTSTAESVPCMFSLLDRENYNVKKARSQESLMDVLQRAGVDVLWRDNNSDCKGACVRVHTEDMRRMKDSTFCTPSECFDEILLQGLQAFIDKAQGDIFVVLHQKGSHGPEYFLRTPDSMKVFKPECNSATVADCSRESIVNAYDNTIVYTDFFLSRVIDFLQQNTGHYDTAMMYMADHGESLGENGIYLHGFPYAIAPEQQRHIGALAWLSDGFAKTGHVDMACVKAHSPDKYSHDNIFHTVLGLLGVSTEAYQPDLDMFKPCRQQY